MLTNAHCPSCAFDFPHPFDVPKSKVEITMRLKTLANIVNLAWRGERLLMLIINFENVTIPCAPISEQILVAARVYFRVQRLNSPTGPSNSCDLVPVIWCPKTTECLFLEALAIANSHRGRFLRSVAFAYIGGLVGVQFGETLFCWFGAMCTKRTTLLDLFNSSTLTLRFILIRDLTDQVGPWSSVRWSLGPPRGTPLTWAFLLISSYQCTQI